MNYQKDFARGIKDSKLYDSFINGTVKAFLSVVQADERFVVHIRNDYLNVYYKSGNVAKIESNLVPDIDEHYFKYTDLTKEKVIALFKKELYKDYLNSMVRVMESYWDGLFYRNHSKTEKRPEDEGEVQQKISINNKNHISDFEVLDLEYQISSDSNNPLRYDGESPYPTRKMDKKTGIIKEGKKISPRFDIIAINAGKLYVIELKKGTSALKGPSGMHDHIDSFLHTIGKNKETKALFVEEMKNLLKQKQVFGLIDKELQIISDDVEFNFAYSYKQPEEKRKREYKSIADVLGTTDNQGIKPEDYRILYLEPGDYKLKI